MIRVVRWTLGGSLPATALLTYCIRADALQPPHRLDGRRYGLDPDLSSLDVQLIMSTAFLAPVAILAGASLSAIAVALAPAVRSHRPGSYPRLVAAPAVDLLTGINGKSGQTPQTNPAI
jgi:hypothetical protein